MSRKRPRSFLSLLRASMLTLAAAGALAPQTRASADIGFSSAPSRSQLDRLTQELGASIAAPALAPAEGLGAFRVETLVSGTATDISSDASFWRIASRGGSFSSFVVLPRATIRLGLPASIDLSASYAKLPGSNIEAAGGAAKWTFVRGSTVLPAFALRLAHDRLRGVDQMDLKATSLDLSVSKGLLFFTPYAGAGRLWLSSDAHDISSAPGFRLSDSTAENRVFVGGRFSAAWFNTLVEAERTGPVESYSVKLAVAFP